MKVVLVFPPAYYPWFVPPGLAYLTAFLRHHDVDVIQRDANIGAIEYLLRPEYLREIGADDEVVQSIDESIDAMRDEKAYHNFERFRWYKGIIERASQYVNATTNDTFLIFRNTLQYVSQYEARKREGVLEAIQNRENNLFYPYFVSEEVKGILDETPDLVGLSVSDHHQLIPAFILASLLKEKAPHVKVCLGGNLLARLVSTLEREEPLNQKLFQYIDFVIHHEGEIPMLELVEVLDFHRRLTRPYIDLIYRLENVHNMIWFDGHSIRSNAFRPEAINLNDLQPPACDGYSPWTPKPVIPLNIYRGCYYSGRCTFCDINAGYDTHHKLEELNFTEPICKRLRNLDSVIEDIKFLRREYDTRFFSFTDEWFRAKEMLQLVQRLQKEGLEDIQWEAYARFEPIYMRRKVCQRLAEGGCRFLQFGLESMSVDTLRQMRKGDSPSYYQPILENCCQADIWTHVFLMLGYPGELLHDVLPAFDFIMRHDDLITTIKPSRFQLARLSYLAYNPPQEIELLLPKNEWDFYINLPFRYKQRYWCPQCKEDLTGEDRDTSKKGWKCPLHGSLLEERYSYSHKIVEAMYTIAEKICEMHPYHRVTSVYPYVTRMFLSPKELLTFSQDAEPVSVISDDVLRKALKKIRNALDREREMVQIINQVYRLSGLNIPNEFESIEAFLSFCSNYTKFASESY